MSVCLSACLSVRPSVCLSACMHAWMDGCMYVCLSVSVCNVLMYVCMYGWMDVWMDGCMDACMHVCMYGWMYVCNVCNVCMSYVYTSHIIGYYRNQKFIWLFWSLNDGLQFPWLRHWILGVPYPLIPSWSPFTTSSYQLFKKKKHKSIISWKMMNIWVVVDLPL